jgi:transmembrane sensor
MTRDNEEVMSISDQAAHWWVVFRDADATPAEKREFVNWARRAPEHVAASLRMARVQAALRGPGIRWPDVPADVLIREAQTASETTVLALFRPTAARSEVRRHPLARRSLAIAASLLATTLLGWLALIRPEEFQTRVGELRSVVLADGSRVTLNAASKVEVRMRADRRSLDLVSGEALFEVAQDAKRPFDVHVGNAIVHAVGTEFDIDRRTDRTVVTVIEGRVSVGTPGAGAQPLPVLSAADRIVIDGTGAVDLQHGVNLTETTAWMHGRLVFDHRPLGEIAAEFNRHNAQQIDIRSPKLREQKFTGTFRSDDVASFVSVLAGIPGVHVTRGDAGNYIVTSHPD